MTEHEFRVWRAPRRQAELFPKAAAWRREHRQVFGAFTCKVCSREVNYRDADPFMEGVCIGCAPTLF